jgi:hypothetical protein
MAVVEVADLGAVVEKNPVALPVEAVREQDLALGADGHPVDIGSGLHAITDAQVDLTVMGLGEGMGLPDRHIDSLPDDDASGHHRSGRSGERVPRGSHGHHR